MVSYDLNLCRKSKFYLQKDFITNCITHDWNWFIFVTSSNFQGRAWKGGDKWVGGGNSWFHHTGVSATDAPCPLAGTIIITRRSRVRIPKSVGGFLTVNCCPLRTAYLHLRVANATATYAVKKSCFFCVHPHMLTTSNNTTRTCTWSEKSQNLWQADILQ